MRGHHISGAKEVASQKGFHCIYILRLVNDSSVGDAILATWPVKTYRDLASAIVRVVKCALTIQAKCGEYMTDVGVKLKVKLGNL